MFARMSNIKLGKLTDEDGESLSDVETALNSVGVKLRENETDYRNYGEVLDEISAKWKTWNDVQKNTVSSAMAGTRRIEDFKTLMNNYGNIQKYTETSANSEGSAMKKFDAYEQGIEARIKKIQASFEKLSMIVASSGTIKFVLLLTDGLLKLLTVGDGLITKTILWSTVVAGLYKVLSFVKGLNLVGRVKMIALQVCPPQTDGDIERVNYRNGIINKSLCRKQLKWCA